MKVSQLIEQLKRYELDDELIVAYWDKETVVYHSDVNITQDEWSCVVSNYEFGEWYWQGEAAQNLTELVENIIEEREAA